MTSEFPIPEALRSLGDPLQVHPPRAGAGRTGYFTTGGILAFLAGLTLIGIVNPPEHNPPPPIVFIAVMGVCGFLAMLCFGMGLVFESRTLILFPEGLARTGGEAPEIFRWSDMKELYTFIHPIVGKHRIVTRDGREFEINAAVKDRKALGETVQKALLDRMLPEAVASFDKGETLTFGPLRLNQGFLHYKHKRLAWNEISKIRLLYNAYTRSLQFEVSEAGALLLPWCVVKAQDIPNLDVFKALAERKKAFTK